MLNKVRITDQRVIEALRVNGYRCDFPEHNAPSGVISFIGLSKLDTPERKKARGWYDTDAPVKWNEELVLPDGQRVFQKGIELVYVE